MLRQQDPALGVDVHFLCIADVEPLQRTRGGIERGKRGELAFDDFPFGLRIEQKTAIPINGDDQMRVTRLLQTLAMLATESRGAPWHPD